MRILQVVPYFFPAWAYGGPAKLVFDTSKFYARSGHQVTVYTSDAYDERRRMPKVEYVNSIENLQVRYFKNINNKLAYFFNIFITLGIIFPSLLEMRRFDIIHLHDFYTLQNVWISLLAKLFNIPYILSVHGCLEEARLKQRSIFKNFFLLFFGRRLLSGASMVIATSPNEVKAYRDFNIKDPQIIRIGHGVDLEEFQTQFSRKQCRDFFQLPLNKVIVTYLGRIHKIKGLDKLIGAIKKISGEKAYFVIAGSNDGYLPNLKRLIKQNRLQKRITLVGTCFGEVKAKLFKTTDIFVYPSYSEGFSLGLLEAGAAGLPLVITTGCHFELVKKYKAGEIVNSDEEELAVALSRFIESRDLRRKASKNVLKLIKENYSIEMIGNKLLNTYEKVLNLK